MRRLVSLESCIAEDDNESLRVLVAAGDWDMLFGDKFWKIGRWERLRGSCWIEGPISRGDRSYREGRHLCSVEVIQLGGRWT